MRRGLWWVLLLVCLASAVGLTALRFVGPSQDLAVRLVSFTPLAVVGYAGVLLLALGKLVLPVRTKDATGEPGPRRRRTPGLLLALVALVGMAIHGWWLAPQFTGSAPPAAQGAEQVTVLTVNLLKGHADVTGVVEAAVSDSVDILVLQEVTPPALATMRRAGLEKAFPHHAGQPRAGVMGTMMFATGPVSQVAALPTGFDSWSATVTLPDAQKLRVLGLHLRTPKDDTTGWTEDLATAGRSVDSEDPDLVVGDFNATTDHVQFRRLLGHGLTDAAERANAGWAPTWPANDGYRLCGVPLPRLVAIDHVLVGPRWTAERVQRVEVTGNDHTGVLATVAAR